MIGRKNNVDVVQLTDGVWADNSITYKISNYSAKIEDTEGADKAIAYAFSHFSDVTPLTFTRITEGCAHIEFIFEKSTSGLAYATYPMKGGARVVFYDQPFMTDCKRGNK